MSYRHILLFSLVLPATLFAEAGPAMHVPSTAIFYAELNDFSQMRKSLAETPVGNLVFSDRPAVSVSMLMGIGKLFLRSITGVDIEAWGLHLGGPAGLAVFDSRQLGAIGEKDPPLVILCKVKSSAEEFQTFREGVRENLLANSPHMQYEAVKVGDGRLDVFVDSRNQKSFSSAFANGYFMLGGRRAVQAVLEAETKLSDTKLFKNAQGLRKEGTPFWSLFDVQKALQWNLQGQGNEKKMKETRISGLPSLAGIFASTQFENGGVRERLVLMRSDVEPLGFALAFTRPKPRELKGSSIVPGDYALFLNAHLESGKAFMDAVLESIGEIMGEEHIAKFDEGKAFLENALKLNLERDFFGNLTGEIVYALHIGDMEEQLLKTGELTKPREWDQFLALSFNDRNVARGVIKSCLDSEFIVKQGFIYEIEETAGFEIFKVRQKDNKFALGLTEGFVVLSKKVDVVAYALRAHKEGKTMAGLPDLKNRLRQEQDGHNLISRVGIDWFMTTAISVLEKFAEPPLAMAMKELRPGLDKLTPGIITARNTNLGFELEVSSSQGILIHVLGVAAVTEAVKNSPGAKAIRARHQLDELAEAIDKYFVGNGSFPPSLAALSPKYIARIANDPFGGGMFQYHPGPKTVEGGRDLYLKGWVLLSKGPDGKQDIPFEDFDLARFQKRLLSEDPADLRYMRQVTYQFRPDQDKLEGRLLDRGDIYVWGLAPH